MLMMNRRVFIRSDQLAARDESIYFLALSALHLPSGTSEGGPIHWRRFWVVLSIIWGLCATVIATLLPLWESWRLIWTVFSRFVTCNTARIDDLSVKPSQKGLMDTSTTPSADSDMDPKVAALGVTDVPLDDGMDPKVGYVDPPTRGFNMTK